MTEFRKHDRVKVVDGTGRIIITTDPGARQLRRGEILTVATPSQKTPAGNITLVELPLSWKGSRFELVEHAVAEDKDGKPLYVGDTVTRRAVGGWEPYEATVRDGQPVNGCVHLSDRSCSSISAPRKFVELKRHHWEEPANPLATSLQNLGRTWAEYRRTEAGRTAKALDAVTEAIQKAINDADEVAEREQAIAYLPGDNGSIVAPANEKDRSRAYLIGGRWLFAGGGETDPTRWPRGFRVILDTDKEDR